MVLCLYFLVMLGKGFWARTRYFHSTFHNRVSIGLDAVITSPPLNAKYRARHNIQSLMHDLYIIRRAALKSVACLCQSALGLR
jgi:hypothetical protein